MLLTTLGAHPSAEDLGRANRIVRWLSTQQNYYGGFYSTQVQASHVTLRSHPPDGRVLNLCVCV